MNGKKEITVLIFLLFIPVFSYALQPAGQVDLVRISGDIYEIRGGRGANGGLFIGEDGVIVIDAKMDKASVDQTLKEIGRLTGKPVRYLVNTHSDGDHVNGNRYFPVSVTIIAHENCRREFFLDGRDGSPSMWLTPDLMPYVPQVTFKDRLDIHMGNDRVELWYFGRGHTSGDIVVYFPEEKVAFIGDQIFLNRVPLIHVHKGGTSHGNVRYLERMLDSLDAERFASGHSDVVGRQEIKDYINTMKARQSGIEKFINKGYSLDQIKNEFSDEENSLVETIYLELTEKQPGN